MKISDVVKLRDDVLRGEILSWIKLRGIFEQWKEADPDYIFNITYPTDEIKNLIEAVNAKLKGERIEGFFELLGGYGTGKSHILVLLYHLFKNPKKAEEWLKKIGSSMKLPADATVAAFSLIDEPPEYLWEPIFKGLNREDLLEKVKLFPGTTLLKEALKDKNIVVLIIDELESWYRSVKDKQSNLNFLQVLAEVACEKGSKLLVFCALYHEVPEIKAVFDRVNPYKVDLTLSKDRPKIITFRLIKEIHKDKVLEIVGGYISHYQKSRVPMLLQEEKMRECYPIHPALMETLLDKYSSSINYQNTRGVLCLLSSALMKNYEHIDLLLTSDIDMGEEDLLSLDRELVENAQKDAEFIDKLRELDSEDKMLARKMLNVILLHTFGLEKNMGASENDVILGVLRPGININDVQRVLSMLPQKAPHVWPKNGKYIIGPLNPIVMIQVKAEENIRSGKIKEAIEVIKEKLKGIAKQKLRYIYHPTSEFSEEIPDNDKVKTVISLKTLEKSEIIKLYEGRNYANTLILFTPKSGDLTKDENLLVVAERMRLAPQFKKEASKEVKEIIERQRVGDDKHLKEKLSEIYGRWIKITKFEPRNVEYRLISCKLNEVESKVKESYGVETLKDEVLNLLEREKDGLKIEEIRESFIITPGKPIILSDKTFNDAIKSLYNERKIIIHDGVKYWDGSKPLPQLRKDLKAMLEKYYKPPEEIIEEEEEEKPLEKPRIKPPEGKDIIISTGEETVKIKKEVVTVKPKEPLRIKISSQTSTLELQNKLERIPENAQISNIKLVFQELSFDDFQSLNDFIGKLNINNAEFRELKIVLEIKGDMRREDVIKLIGKLPNIPRGGSVEAEVEGWREAE